MNDNKVLILEVRKRSQGYEGVGIRKLVGNKGCAAGPWDMGICGDGTA